MRWRRSSGGHLPTRRCASPASPAFPALPPQRGPCPARAVPHQGELRKWAGGRTVPDGNRPPARPRGRPREDGQRGPGRTPSRTGSVRDGVGAGPDLPRTDAPSACGAAANLDPSPLLLATTARLGQGRRPSHADLGGGGCQSLPHDAGAASGGPRAEAAGFFEGV